MNNKVTLSRKKINFNNIVLLVLAVLIIALILGLSICAYINSVEAKKAIEEKNNAADIRELNCKRGIGDCRGYNEINRLKDIQFGN